MSPIDEPLVEATVRVPGSTSNLGAGFDCLGLTVALHLTTRFRPDAEPDAGKGGELRLIREGTLSGLDDSPEEDLLVRAFTRALGGTPSGELTVDSEIPVGKGLGSSAAALVAGAALADAVRSRPVDATGAFRRALEVEGHGDNAAPSALGGLLAVVDGANGPRPLRLELSPEIAFGFAAPEAPLSTRRAREALPASVPHRTAAGGVRRVVALVRGLATGDPELLRAGLADEIHVPHRLPLIPGAAEAIDAAVQAGAWGGTLSGAGSGLVLLGPPDRISQATAAAAEALKGPAEVRVLEVAEEGVTVRPA